MEFLFELYGTTRLDVQEVLDWTHEQKQQFLRVQFDAQHRHYQTHFSSALFSVILNHKNKRIGRLYLNQTDSEIRIVDIAILPDQQQSGFGSAIVQDVMEQCRVAGLPLRLHVAKWNPALTWYQGMGFKTIEETDMTFHMEWSVTDSICTATTPVQLSRF